MTYAFSDMTRDTGIAADRPARMQVAVVAPTADLAARMSAPMTSDPAIDTDVTIGTLAEVVLTRERDWTACDFLIFAVAGDETTMLAAVHCILAKPRVHMHCVAMIDGPVDPELEARLMSAGASTVLSIPAEAPPRTNVQSRIHLSAPEKTAQAPLSVPLSQAEAEAEANGICETTREPDVATQPLCDDENQTGSGRITTILRARGGAGASTVAVNLALHLANSGKCVAIVDLDIQNGSVAVLMDMPDSAHMTQLLQTGKLANATFLDRAMTRHSSGVDVLAAPDVFVPMDALTPEMVATMMTHLQQRYDHVIVDMPQAMLNWIEPVLDRASQALIVTDTSVPAIKRTRRLIDVLNEDHMTLTIEVVVNKEKRPFMLSNTQKEAACLLGRRLDHWIPEDATRARKALDAGVPFIAGMPRSRPARAIASLGKSLYAPKRTRSD